MSQIDNVGCVEFAGFRCCSCGHRVVFDRERGAAEPPSTAEDCARLSLRCPSCGNSGQVGQAWTAKLLADAADAKQFLLDRGSLA